MATFFNSLFSRNPAKAPVGGCPQQKCSVTVFVHVQGSGIGGVDVTLQPGGKKTTSGDGLAEWPGLDPDVLYAATAALSPEDAKDYRITPPSSQNATVGKGVNHKFQFEVEALSFPRVKVTEAGTGTAIPEVAVVLGGVDLGATGRTGITEFTRDAAGIPAGKHAVQLTLRAEDQKLYEFVATPEVTVVANSGATFEFQVRKLARPKVKVTREDNGQAVPGVAVLLGAHDLGVTDAQGIAQLAADAKGIPAANYDVSLAFHKDDDDWFVWAAANPKADVQAGSTATFEFKVKPVGQIEVLVQRYDAKVSPARAKFKVDGPTPSAGLATNAPSGTEPADTQYVQKVALGDYSIQLEELQALLDAQKSGSGSIREKWRVGPDKTGIIKLKVEHRKPAKAQFTLTKLDKVQFVAFNITPPGTYKGDPDPSKDLGMRCLLMKDAVDKALAHGSVVHDDEVLKIFMAPEFYFRGLDGAYPEEMLSSVMEQLRPHVQKNAFKNWLFCFGSGIGYLKHGESTVDYELEYVSKNWTKVRVKDSPAAKASVCANIGGPFPWTVQQGSHKANVLSAAPIPSSDDYELTLSKPIPFKPGNVKLTKPMHFELKVKDATLGAMTTVKVEHGADRTSILSRIPAATPAPWKLLQAGAAYDIVSATDAGGGEYTIRLKSSGVFTNGPVYIVEPAATEIFNVAYVLKGGPEGSGTGLRESIVYKETTSHIDYAGINPNTFYDPSNVGRKITIHGQAQRVVLATGGGSDRLAQDANPLGTASEVSTSGLGGGSVFQIDGITFGLEVCKDHSENKLYKFYQDPSSKGSPSVQIHLIPSWGMQIDYGAVVGVPGVLVFNVDGPEGSAAGKANSSSFKCKHHPAQTSATPQRCPLPHYACSGNHVHVQNAGGPCTWCGVPVNTFSTYKCDQAAHYFDTDTCPLCGDTGLPYVATYCPSCNTDETDPNCPSCGTATVDVYQCTRAVHGNLNGPGNCLCNNPKQLEKTEYYCVKHEQSQLTGGPCPHCASPLGAFVHNLSPDWTAQAPSGGATPTSVTVTGDIPVIDTLKQSTATVNVTADQTVLFDTPGMITVYPVMDIPEAGLHT